MAELQAEQRRAVVYRYGLDGGAEGERTVEDVAKVMNVSEAQANRLIASGMKALDVKDDDERVVASVRERLNDRDRNRVPDARPLNQ